MTGFAPQVASYHGTKLVFTELLRGPPFFYKCCKKNSLHALYTCEKDRIT